MTGRLRVILRARPVPDARGRIAGEILFREAGRMSIVGAVGSTSAGALALFRADLLSQSRSVLEGGASELRSLDTETADPASTPVEVALQTLDLRPERHLSLKTAHAVHDLAAKVRVRDEVGDMPSDAAFAESMADTPAIMFAKMKALGATRWVWRPEVHLTGEAYFKALATAAPRDYGKPGSVAEAVFIRATNKHPAVLRGSDVPEAGLVAGQYDMYNDKGYIGRIDRKTATRPISTIT
jgi:hypothetical protein